ncbi:unnamed protein product [Symbiodinium sp. CCMP2592]|nr:unnamed protein product [Symbiodinium sp. CCMP2592]
MELRDLLGDFPHLKPLAGRWSVCRLATLSDLSTAELGSLLLRELGLASLEDCVLQEFEQLIAQASDLAASRWARSARVESSVEWASAAAKFRRFDASLPLAAGSVCLLTAWAPVVENKQKRLRQGHWPTRSHGAASLSAVDQARQAEEDKQRCRWLSQLQRLIATSGLPAAEAGISGRVGKGRRASTLRKHVKTWERVVAWVRSAFGVSWPSADHFAAYLQARASEPCGRSVPGSCLKTLMFMESAGEVPLDSKISRCPVIRNTMEELALVLGNQDLRGRRQANQLLVSQVKAFEGLVMNEQAPRYVRAFAWFKLVKLWGCLRYSDTEGMPARAIVVDERGLSARLERTKTTGAGKKIAVLYAYVSSAVWLVEPCWLRVGWQLWQAMGDETAAASRDFFLLRPAAGLQGCTARMARYYHASAMSQALFRELRTDGVDGRELMALGLGVLWSEHSERATMRSWAACCRVGELAGKQLGRWQMSVDEAYIRSVRGNVEAAQRKVARVLRRGIGGRDLLDEASVLSKVASRLEELGFDPESVSVQVALLSSFATKQLDDGSATEEELSDESEQVASPAGLDAEDNAEDAADWHLGLFFVSLTGQHGRQQTLHKGGECHRVPGVHYRHFKQFGDRCPAREEYGRKCRDCFPSGEPVASASSSSESSDSSSSSGAESEG